MNHICPTCYQPLPPSDDLTVSLDENTVIWKGICCQLRPKEAEIMSILAGHVDWLTVDQIYGKLYAGSEWPQEKTLTVHISHIRYSLKDAGIPIVIESGLFRGVGGFKYRLKYG